MPRLVRRAPIAAIVLALLLAACGGGSSDSAATSSSTAKQATDHAPIAAGGYVPTGPLVADNGFRPENDGFAFENYGKTLPDGSDAANLSSAEMRKLFGDGVCQSATAAECNLTPLADQWMAAANQSTQGGHCQGFSVLSGMLWQKQVDVAAFGGSATPALAVAGNEALQRELAYAFTFQSLDAYNASILKGTPTDILDKLIEVLKPDSKESYTLGIYKADMTGGHAVTPYAVEDAGGGVFNILIYDNNYPGVTRAIKVDRNANTWSYNAAVNPDSPSELYEGDASTRTIDLEPTSPGEGTQPCPFCEKRSDDAAANGTKGSTANPSKGAAPSASDATADPGVDTSNLMWIYLDASDDNHGHLLITDAAGHRLGFVDGKFVNEMPGSVVRFPKGVTTWSHAQEPDYFVPDGVAYTITLDGKALTEADASSIGIIGPGFDLYVDDISLDPGEVETLAVTPDVETFTYSTTGAEQASFEVAFNEDTDYTLTLSSVALSAGHDLSVALPVGSGALTVNGAPGASVNVGVDREDADEDATFKHDGLTYAEGDNLTVHYADWVSVTQPLTVDIDHAGAVTPQQLDNQA